MCDRSVKIVLFIHLGDKLKHVVEKDGTRGQNGGNWKTFQLLSEPSLHSTPSLWFKINSQKGGLGEWVKKVKVLRSTD